MLPVRIPVRRNRVATVTNRLWPVNQANPPTNVRLMSLARRFDEIVSGHKRGVAASVARGALRLLEAALCQRCLAAKSLLRPNHAWNPARQGSRD